MPMTSHSTTLHDTPQQNYQHFPTFGRKITFYAENYAKTPLPTTPTTTEIEKLERDLFSALDELAKKYSKKNNLISTTFSLYNTYLMSSFTVEIKDVGEPF